MMSSSQPPTFAQRGKYNESVGQRESLSTGRGVVFTHQLAQSTHIDNSMIIDYKSLRECLALPKTSI